MQSRIYLHLSNLKNEETLFADTSGILSLVERERFNRMRFSKRRYEWMHGRIAAKELLKRSNAELTGLCSDEITVANEAEGAPFFIIGDDTHLPISLSISHRDDIAFCSLTYELGMSVGVDVERIEPRNNEFVNDYFTSAETAWISACQPSQTPLIANLIWSAKEAMLKSLHKGLRLDTRQVEILSMDDNCDREVTAGWHKLNVRCHAVQFGEWLAWWRSQNDYIFTIAVWIKDGKSRDILMSEL